MSKTDSVVEPLYWTARDVAAMLQVDESTIFRWAATDSTMPVWRKRKGTKDTVRFHRKKLLAWLEQHEHGRCRKPAQTQ